MHETKQNTNSFEPRNKDLLQGLSVLISYWAYCFVHSFITDGTTSLLIYRLIESRVFWQESELESELECLRGWSRELESESNFFGVGVGVGSRSQNSKWSELELEIFLV